MVVTSQHHQNINQDAHQIPYRIRTLTQPVSARNNVLTSSTQSPVSNQQVPSCPPEDQEPPSYDEVLVQYPYNPNFKG